MKKKIVVITLILLFLVAAFPADANEKKLSLYFNEKKLLFNSVQPIIKDGRILVPVKFFQETGAKVSYHSEDKSIIIVKNNLEISLNINSSNYLIGGKVCTSDVSPEVINMQVMVPLRYICEKLGFQVLWNADNNSVKIKDQEKISWEWLKSEPFGNIFTNENRELTGSWKLDSYLNYMDFEVIVAENQYLSMPPLKTLAPVSPPKTDYNKYLVFWAYLGQADAQGFDIKIVDIEKENSTVNVYVKLISPEQSAEPGQGDEPLEAFLSYPQDFVRISKSNLDLKRYTVNFIDQESGRILKITELNLTADKIVKNPTEQVKSWVNANISTETVKIKTISGKKYLLIAMGEQRSGGFNIELQEIKQNEEKLIFNIFYVKPNANDFVSMAITYPYLLFDITGNENIEVNLADGNGTEIRKLKIE